MESLRHVRGHPSMPDRRLPPFRLPRIFFGLAMLVYLSWATQDTHAAVDLVGSWTGETLFETNGFNYTPGAGSNRIALVMISAENNGASVSDVGSVTLGGQTLTAIQNANGVVVDDGNRDNILWLGYLNESQIASMSGNALSITWDTTPNTPDGEIKVQAATYENVDQATPIAASASNTNTSASTIQAGSVTVGTCDRLVYVTLDGQPSNHTAPAGYTEQIEQDGTGNDFSNASAQRDTTNASTENPTATWSVTWRLEIISAVLNSSESTLGLADHTVGQESDAFTESGGETDAELFAFELDSGGDTITVTELVFSLSGISGLVDGDWAGIEIVVDANADGNVGGGETTTVGGAGTVSTSSGTITFSTNFNVTAATSYILRADFSSLSDSDTVTVDLTAANTTTTACKGGSTTSVTHFEGCQYTENFQTWTASSPDTWQTQNLSGAPFNVPANAIVEIAVRNDERFVPRSGGVRAVGSGLDRRFTLQEAEAGGFDVVVMHVQVNASSQIQHYSDVTADVDFVLLGYWAPVCGTYVETFNTFTAGASTSWQDEDLCPYGVGPNGAAEIVMTNDDPALPREAGVRTNGSSLERRLDLHNAEAGGVDTATMFVRADASANATVELYAEDDADVDFFIVGYWSSAPGSYNELYADVGSPSADTTWEDIDLTSNGVADNGIAEFALSNDFTFAQNEMGVRANGSSLSRLLDLQEAEDGGGSFGRMHVQTDGTATIEFYHEDVSNAHTFRLVGYWGACDTSISYVISDLGAVTAANSSLGWHINSTKKVAGFDEDASGDPDAWFLDCGTFTTLGVLGGSDAEAHGINSNDMVVGWSDDGSSNRRAYTWTSGGGMTDLGTVAGRTDSEALSVNGNSEVVGTVVDFDASAASKNRLAFLYLPSSAYTLSAGMNSLGTLGGSESVGMDLNDSGQVVGGAQNASGNFRPFRWATGTMTDLGTLGGDSFLVDHRAEAINASGNVCGRSYTVGGAKHAFYYDGSMTDMGVLTGGSQSWAFGINDSNVVVGTSEATGSVFRAFVWDSTNGMRNLNNLIPTGTGWTLLRATDINSDGYIVGFGTNGSAENRAFLLAPSCSTGGGGAAAKLLAFGDGTIDGTGRFEEIAVSHDNEPLAEIVVMAAEPGATLEYAVIGGDRDADGKPVLAPGTLAGLADGVALARTLQIDALMSPGTFVVTVSFITSLDELADLDVSPEDLELHVFDPARGLPPGQWVNAGKNIGEAEPTGVLGESGFVVYSDGSVDYWAVSEKFGVFAVGKPDDASPAVDSVRPPSMCGIGMLPPLFIAASMFFVLRRGRRSYRKFAWT